MKIFRLCNIFWLLLIFQSGFSQFKTAFDIKNKTVKVVYFEANQVSEIHLKTHKQSKFQFNSSSEGSYKSELYLNYQIIQDSLIIKSSFPKNLEFGDNKMTSMQEFSVKVNFIMPKNIKLIINSDLASVYGQGHFKSFLLNTKSGQCKLTPFSGNASINTYSGNIIIATKDAVIEAYSQNGIVDVYDFLINKNQIKLKTVNGDIIVTQME